MCVYVDKYMCMRACVDNASAKHKLTGSKSLRDLLILVSLLLHSSPVVGVLRSKLPGFGFKFDSYLYLLNISLEGCPMVTYLMCYQY